jgi:nucleoside-diphosphate-sugar epimerase
MKVLVVGGTRFFGKTLVERLLSAGHAVTVLSRGKLPPPAGAAHLGADRTDAGAVQAALAGQAFDAVVDNVAMNAEHVLAALGALGDRVGHYVLTSSISAYGDFSVGRLWHESDLDAAALALPPRDDHPYVIGKRAAERALFRGEHGAVPFTIVRPGFVVGPHDHLRRAQFFVRRLRDGGPLVVPTGASEVFQLAWHADVAALLARVLGDPAAFGQAYNAVGGELFTYPTLARALGAAAGSELACVEVPRALLRRGPLAGQELPFGEEGLMWACDGGRARRELGLPGTPASAWLAEMAQVALPEPSAKERAEREAERGCARSLGAVMPGRRSRIRG